MDIVVMMETCSKGPIQANHMVLLLQMETLWAVV